LKRPVWDAQVSHISRRDYAWRDTVCASVNMPRRNVYCCEYVRAANGLLSVSVVVLFFHIFFHPSSLLVFVAAVALSRKRAKTFKLEACIKQAFSAR